MKKFLSLAMVAALSLSLVACGSSSSSDSTSDADDTATEDTTAEDTTTEDTTDDAEDEETTTLELSGSITAAGSSALKPLVDDAADAFTALYPDVSITVDAGGSGEGLKQVYEGTVDIGNSDVYAEEKLEEDQAAELVDHQVCVVTMACIVNPDITEAGVTSLTTDELIAIFTGEITNWSEVGGPDEDIILITRPSSSGTRATFQKYALNGEEEASNSAMETDDSGVLLQNVADTAGAIGYVALSYLVGDDTGVSTMAIDGVEPTLENTYNGTYNVWAFEHMYTYGEPDEVTAAFIDYIMSDEYGELMEDLGYGVASKMTVTDGH